MRKVVGNIVGMETRRCATVGCERQVWARGRCGTCYARWRQEQPGPLRLSPTARFWEKVNKDGPEPPAFPGHGACWVWQGYTGSSGYGRLRVEGVFCQAHRYAYELLVGPIPEGLQLDHLCRVRSCVNPAHLEPVTARENKLRSVPFIRAETPNCPAGHPWDERNTRWSSSATGVARQCRACAAERGRRTRAEAQAWRERIARDTPAGFAERG